MAEYDLTQISSLPIKTEELSGSEDVPIDDNGVTKRIKTEKLLTPAQTTFSDEEFRIYDESTLNDLKIDVGELTSNRQLNAPDKDGTILTELEDDTAPKLGGDLLANNNRVLQSRGSDVPSASTISLSGTQNGNTWLITGTTGIELINNTAYTEGSVVKLLFEDALTITNEATESGNNKPIRLSKGSNYTTTAGDLIELTLADGVWVETNTSKDSGSTTVFSDADFKLQNDSDPTKEGQFDLSEVDAGQNKILKWPNHGGKIRTRLNINTNFSDPKQFNFEIGETYSMNLTGDTTISAAGLESAGRYLIILNVDSTGGYAVTFDSSIGIPKDNSFSAITNAKADSVYFIYLETTGLLETYYTILGSGTDERLSNVKQNSITSASSVTPTGDSKENEQYITALAANLTINAPSGTASNGNSLLIRIEDDGTSRTLTWDSIYEVVGVSLPTATTAGKKIYIGCIYNSADTKWDVVSVIEES